MAFAEDLLELARQLASLEEGSPRQASLRRAISTAYYALFHLLVSEATSNWSRVDQRPALGRVFEHGKMRNSSERRVSDLNKFFKNEPREGPELTLANHLYIVANAFIQAQQLRNEANYDTSKDWTRTDVLTQIDAVAQAFTSWKTIREEPIAQAYLVSFLTKDRPNA